MARRHCMLLAAVYRFHPGPERDVLFVFSFSFVCAFSCPVSSLLTSPGPVLVFRVACGAPPRLSPCHAHKILPQLLPVCRAPGLKCPWSASSRCFSRTAPQLARFRPPLQSTRRPRPDDATTTVRKAWTSTCGPRKSARRPWAPTERPME